MNTLNIVYQDDDEKEKIIRRLEDLDNFLKFTHIDELKKDEIYHYLYISQSYITNDIKKSDTLLLKQNLIQKCKQFDVKVYYICDAESDGEDIFELLETQIQKEGLNPPDFTVINGNQKLPILKSKSKSKINFHISNKLQESVSKDVIRNKEDINFHKKYLFQCYNGTVKEHRLMTLSMLHHYNLLDNTNWTFLKMNKDYNIQYLHDVFKPTFTKKYEKNINYIIEQGQKLSNEENFNFFQPPFYLNYSKAYEKNSYKFSYVNIVTESQYERKNTIHITEKSLVPFYFFQIPIFVSTVHHVKYLKDIYNFDLFEDIISHEYDNEIDDEKRIEKAFEQICKLNEYDMETFYTDPDIIKRLYQNRNKVKTLVFNQKDHFFFKSLMT